MYNTKGDGTLTKINRDTNYLNNFAQYLKQKWFDFFHPWACS